MRGAASFSNIRQCGIAIAISGNVGMVLASNALPTGNRLAAFILQLHTKKAGNLPRFPAVKPSHKCPSLGCVLQRFSWIKLLRAGLDTTRIAF